MRVVLTHIPDSWAWMRSDLLVRILPFTVMAAGVEILWRPTWLGISPGRVGVQLAFAALAAPVLFVGATLVQLWLTRRRGAISVPADSRDAWFQAGFYLVNGPVEEAFFRGLIQGGLGAAFGAPVGFLVATVGYVVYHRLGWPWADTLATALVGIPVGLAFWFLPGPPSLLGVSIAHVAATCGFLGPGPYLLKRFGFI
jgi:membrane protease YdiL (CAAX protease family)